MRVTDNMNYNQVTQGLNRNRKESADLNMQAATMKRVTKPSDDPSSAVRVLAARSDIAGNAQYEKNLNYTKSFMEFSEQSLGELNDLLVRLKELALGQANAAGANADTRRATSTEVEQAFRQSLQIGNRKLGDRFLFGGFKTTQPPFGGNGEYRGDEGELMVEIEKSSYVPMNLPGDKVFLGKNFNARNLFGFTDGVPKTAEDLMTLQGLTESVMPATEEVTKPTPHKSSETETQIRGPASTNGPAPSLSPKTDGENIFSVIQSFHTALVTNDVAAIQDTLDRFDETINQVVMARSQLGSRLSSLSSTMESLGRQTIDTKTLASSAEDANAFELFSDMSKNETTLKATLESSGRLITPSLLDFLK